MNGTTRRHRPSLRVAVVGSGPAGLYAAVDLLGRNARAQVEMFERLPVPGGLARFGVAPDHAARRRVVDFYLRLAVASGRFRLHANVDVGSHVGHAELLQHCHAVVYASGATSDRRLDVPGETLPGCHAASDFVAWYNGHPDLADRSFDLDVERAVVIGNGNVALDVARMLLRSPRELSATDVASPALLALAASRVREVVILGRRGPAQVAFTLPELVELAGLKDVDIVVDAPPALLAEEVAAAHPLRLRRLRELAARPCAGHERRLVLRFLTTPAGIDGRDRVQGVRLVRNRLAAAADGTLIAEPAGSVEVLPAGLVLRAVGLRARPVPGLPFDEKAGVVPNVAGRVVDPVDGRCVPGTYVTGWLKRGPGGVIGSNKPCAQQTVAALLEDEALDRLPPPPRPAEAFDEWLSVRRADRLDYRACRRIDRAEQRQGAAAGRPRVRLDGWAALLAAAR